MEEQNIPNNPTVQPAPTAPINIPVPSNPPTIAPQSKNGLSAVKILLVLLVVIGLAAVGYLAYKNMVLKKQLGTQETTSSIPTPVETTAPLQTPQEAVNQNPNDLIQVNQSGNTDSLETGCAQVEGTDIAWDKGGRVCNDLASKKDALKTYCDANQGVYAFNGYATCTFNSGS